MSSSPLVGEFWRFLWSWVLYLKSLCAGLIGRIQGLYKSLSRDLRRRWQTLPINYQNSQGSPMSDETSSRGDLQDSTVESVTSNGPNSPVSSSRLSITLPKDARDLIVSVILSLSVLTNLWLWSKLHDAEKDIQTQVWLRDDALTKFEQGPFADVKAHVLALEMLYKQEKSK